MNLQLYRVGTEDPTPRPCITGFKDLTDLRSWAQEHGFKREGNQFYNGRLRFWGTPTHRQMDIATAMVEVSAWNPEIWATVKPFKMSRD